MIGTGFNVFLPVFTGKTGKYRKHFEGLQNGQIYSQNDEILCRSLIFDNEQNTLGYNRRHVFADGGNGGIKTAAF